MIPFRTTKKSAPTPGVDTNKKCLRNKYYMFYKIVISLSICGLRDMCYAKVLNKMGHMKVPRY
jgi:hypothetical protein